MSNVVEFAVASYHKTHRLFLSLGVCPRNNVLSDMRH